MTNNLLPPTDEEREELANMLSVSSGVNTADLPGYLDVLQDPRRSPLPQMQVERQQRSDCQGNAAANGVESTTWGSTGVMPVLSEMFAYNASEYLMGPRNVGRDSGSSMHSGVRLMARGIPELDIEPGIPTEADWPYTRYCRSASEFERYARGIKTESAWLKEVQPMPSWDEALALVAARGRLHIGTWWDVKWKTASDGTRIMSRAPTRGGGHATTCIWARYVDREWFLADWNSHGYGHFLIPQGVYEGLQRTQCDPFGGFALIPPRMVERYNRVQTGGGYV